MSSSEKFLCIVQNASALFQNHTGTVSFDLLLLGLHFVIMGFDALWYGRMSSVEINIVKSTSEGSSLNSAPHDSFLPQDAAVQPAILKTFIPADQNITHALPLTYNLSS